MSKDMNYELWMYKAPYSDEPDGWSVSYFQTMKEAKAYAKDTVAEEMYIEVTKDSHWVNDHIETVFVKKVHL